MRRAQLVGVVAVVGGFVGGVQPSIPPRAAIAYAVAGRSEALCDVPQRDRDVSLTGWLELSMAASLFGSR